MIITCFMNKELFVSDRKPAAFAMALDFLVQKKIPSPSCHFIKDPLATQCYKLLKAHAIIEHHPASVNEACWLINNLFSLLPPLKALRLSL